VNEFELIDVLLGEMPSLPETVVIGPGRDDAAALRVEPGTEWVLTTDTLVAGRHFPEDCPPALLARRALAVNLSDLAAMGAAPGAYLVALTAPALDAPWLRAFAAGLKAAQGESGACLVGGNLARGPLAVTVTATGTVPVGQALRRDGARTGHGVWVSGRVGAAATALAALRQAPETLAGLAGADAPDALAAYLTPTPRVALGQALRDAASACIDVSDGLLADLGHLCAASGVGARIALERVPTVGDPRSAVAAGDDYELLFTLPPAAEDRVDALAAAGDAPLTRIGRIVEEPGVVLLDSEGEPLPASGGGWDHFRDAGP
jgi:thiamine-monophosphate kinase